MDTSRLASLCLAVLSAGVPAGLAATLTPTEAGIVIEAGATGRFTLEYPVLIGTSDRAPAEKRPAGNRVALAYAGGAKLEAEIGKDGTVVFRPSGLPADVQKVKVSMLIDFSFTDGGRWQVDANPDQPFPETKPEKPFLFQGTATGFRLWRAAGGGLTFGLPDYSYQQLQDNREWNWKVFAWQAWIPCPPGTTQFALRITDLQRDASGPVARIDRFGQDSTRKWPGKVTSEDELKADAQADAARYAAFHPPARDRFGGLPGSGAELGLRKTGFFHVEKKNDRWCLVDPDGNLFFHLALCGFQPSDDYTFIEGRRELFEWLPPLTDPLFGSAYHPEGWWHDKAFSFYIANVVRKAGKPFDREAWQADMIDRVRALGFNSAGAFSGMTPAAAAKSFPHVGSLPLGTWQLGRQIPALRGFFDPFDPETVRKIDELFAKSLPAAAQDPLLIGYFLENEQACEDIPRVVAGLPADAPAKQRLVAWLREKYGTPAAFSQAWALTVDGFEALLPRGLPVTTPAAGADLDAFTALFLETYYRVVTEAFRRHDPNHLLLGNRWQPGTANRELLVRSAAKYVDVLSLNYYTYAFDTAYLERLHGWGGDKPWILSEWHYACPAESGLPGGAKDVPTQKARASAYRHYVEQAAALGYIVGSEWFTLIDQARSGRFFEKQGGENGNTGLFSVADRPWADLAAACAETHARIYDVALGKTPPFSSDLDLLRVRQAGRKTAKVAHLATAPVIDGQLEGWPNFPPELVTDQNQVVGSEKVGLQAAFRLAWDERALYLLADVTDPTPTHNDQAAGNLWNADCLELFVGHESPATAGAPLFSDRQILLGAGKPDGAFRSCVVNHPEAEPCRLTVVPRGDGKGYLLEAAIPFVALGFAPKSGMTLLFDLAVDDGRDGTARQRQIVWSGTDRNSGDRGPWGRAMLSE